MNSLRLKLALALLATLVWSVGSASNYILPSNVHQTLNIAYGTGPLQKLDVYTPQGAHGAPVILMVHGGGWFHGDKRSPDAVENKINYWVASGTILVSVNYPLMPSANPLQQAHYVAQALAYAQRHAADWGGDPKKFIVMGFSAGGHLVALLASNPSIATSMGAQPWLGTVALDAAIYDVPQAMANPQHPALYNQAFGTDAKLWNAASPTTQLRSRIAPFYAVCTSLESELCVYAQQFVDKAKGYGSQANLLQVSLVHEQIDANLGLPSSYTSQVNQFIVQAEDGVLH